MNLDDLKKPFDRQLISWRVGATNKDKTKGIALAYIDARDVMERLDEVCGVGGWQVTYPHANGKTIASIGIKVGDEWIWKSNGAGDTQVEAEKGAISDALKRAAVCWGVGRYLYDVENTWVDLEPCGRSYKIMNPNDKRLSEALAAAEKGVRYSPFSEDEMKELESSIKSDLEEGKAKARASWKRMTETQQQTVTKMIEKAEPKKEAA